MRDDGRAIRLMIAAGAGLPGHYRSEGGGAIRETAVEKELSVIKRGSAVRNSSGSVSAGRGG